MGSSWLGTIGQVSYTTDDLDQFIKFWETQVGVGPWNVYRGMTMTMTFEDRPISFPFDVALTVHGNVIIELLQVHGPGPSPFHDGLHRRIVGMQRLAAISDKIEEDAEAAASRGMERFAFGRDVTGQRYMYFRSPVAPGVILELLEAAPSFTDLLNSLETRSRAYASVATTQTAKRQQGPPLPSHGSMIAALLDAYGDPHVFRIASVPEPVPGPGEIRVKVAGAAVNPVDVKSRRGFLKEWIPLSFPAQIGGDVAGTVDAVGEGVTSFAVGDRVRGLINPFAHGGYAEQISFLCDAVTHVPERHLGHTH